MVTLRCDETPRLKLGPGTTSSWPGAPGHFDQTRGEWTQPSAQTPAGNVIVFGPVAPDKAPGVMEPGYAHFNEQDFPKWREWVSAPGTPAVFEVDEATGLPVQQARTVREQFAALIPQTNPLAPKAEAVPAKAPRSPAQIAATKRMLAAAAAKKEGTS